MNETVELASQIAHRAHFGQFRRDGVTPYINHPAGVAERVGGDEFTVAAAWLHDVLEDTFETPESLMAAGIPQEVIDTVICLTHKPGDSYDDYLDRVATNSRACTVKVADLLHNLSDNPTRKQIRKYAKALLRIVEVH